MPARDEVVMGFDFGTQRIGVALGNRLTATARPLATVASVGDARWARIGELLEQWAPSRLVVGVPRHPDGAAHDMTARAEKFARQLEGRFRLAVERVDERYSTTAAAESAGHRTDLDAVAAAVILQQWLDAPRDD